MHLIVYCCPEIKNKRQEFQVCDALTQAAFEQCLANHKEINSQKNNRDELKIASRLFDNVPQLNPP
jgi:hypothetical protein